MPTTHAAENAAICQDTCTFCRLIFMPALLHGGDESNYEVYMNLRSNRGQQLRGTGGKDALHGIMFGSGYP